MVESQISRADDERSDSVQQLAGAEFDFATCTFYVCCTGCMVQRASIGD